MSSALFYNIFELFTLIICVMYPVWRSFKLLEAKKFDIELILWLTFWMIQAVVTKFEDFFAFGYFQIRSDHYQSGYFYRLLKIVVYVWLIHPKYQGALIIYYKQIEPFFKMAETQLRENTIQALMRMFLALDQLEVKVKQAITILNKPVKQKVPEDRLTAI